MYLTKIKQVVRNYTFLHLLKTNMKTFVHTKEVVPSVLTVQVPPVCLASF